MADLTSEKIAKALKGAGLNSKQRIEKAKEAWNNANIFFPNKDDFLFDWICSVFAKPNLKKLDDCCLLQLPYWQLLVDLLQHYLGETGLDTKRSIPAIHINFCSCISILLQQLYKNNEYCLDEKIAFLTISHQCLDILFSDSFTLSYRPAFEHVTNAVDQMLITLSMQVDLCREGNEGEIKALSELCSTAQVLFHKFDSQLILAANQKKIFTTIVDKSLIKLLNVRRKISLCDKNIAGTSTISQTITDIVCHSLFHTDTVLEFTSVLKDASMEQTVHSNVKQTSYVVKLFDTLKTMVNNKKDTDQMLDMADITPVLFSAFLVSFRQKRNTTTSAMQDISRMAEFGIFINLYKILGDLKETAETTYLNALSRLLKELLQWNVYNTRNDDIAKSQQDVLNRIADDVITFLGNPKKYDQALILDIADTLLQIDFSLVENRVQAIWPILLNSEDEAQESCLRFAKSILNTYSASRQLDVFISNLITHIENIEFSDVYTLLTKPMFTRDFLNEFSSLISKSMPAAQALGIFQNLQENLIAQVMKPDSDTRQSKKQKQNKTKRKQCSSALLITTYLVEFTKALRLNQHQLRSLGESALSVFFDFIKPSINAWTEAQDVPVEETILPAIQIHSALLTTFFEAYINKLGEENLVSLAKSYVKIFQYNEKKDTLGSRVVIAQVTNAMLQHAYYSSLVQSLTDTRQTADLVNIVVDFVTSKEKHDGWYEKTQWSGSILDLKNKDILKLACFKLLTDEWFESIVRFIDSERAKKIVDIIYTSLTKNTVSCTSVTAQSLNKTLLRSANFYEAKCFKDCNIQIILNIVVELFKTKLMETSDGEMAKTAAQMISSVDITKPINVDPKEVKHLTEAIKTQEDAMDQDIKASSTDNVNKISTLMTLLLLFPIEYYEKNQRSQVLHLSTLIDIWSVNCASADLEIRMKVSLLCRSLHMRFIGYFSTSSILGLDSTMLNWMVTSYQTSTALGEYKEIDNIFKPLQQVTNDFDLSILRKTIMNAGAKAADEYAIQYLQDTLKQRVHGLCKSSSKASLNKLVNLLRATNSVLSNRKSSTVELSNIIYATNEMRLVSQYVISSLQNAKDTIIDAFSLKKTDSRCTTKNFGDIKCTFLLSRLLQEYAHIVGPSIDKVIEAETLSKALIELDSPLIQLLKSTPTESAINDALLDMTTEFIGAFCSIISRYQQADTTKRVMGALWFVYTLVYKTGDQESLKVLSNAFASWVQSLPKEQYTIVFESFIEQAKDAAHNTEKYQETNNLVFLALFSLLLSHCTDVEKGRLRKQIPSIILQITLVASKTTSLEYMLHMLKLLIQLTGEQSYHFKEYDASLLLACLLQVVNPTAADRFHGQMTRDIAESMFVDICSVLSNFVSLHKEQLVYMLPPFIALTQSLLHCFKSTHVSLVMTANKKRKHSSKEENSKKEFASNRSITLLNQFAPLDDACAQRFARVLTTIPQKQQHNLTKHAKSVQTLQKIMSKHTHSILIEYFTIQSNPTMSVVIPSIKSILVNALYDILDMCSEADRNYILSCLDGPGKALFKSFYTNWKDNHKYTGQ